LVVDVTQLHVIRVKNIGLELETGLALGLGIDLVLSFWVSIIGRQNVICIYFVMYIVEPLQLWAILLGTSSSEQH